MRTYTCDVLMRALVTQYNGELHFLSISSKKPNGEAIEISKSSSRARILPRLPAPLPTSSFSAQARSTLGELQVAMHHGKRGPSPLASGNCSPGATHKLLTDEVTRHFCSHEGTSHGENPKASWAAPSSPVSPTQGPLSSKRFWKTRAMVQMPPSYPQGTKFA